MTRMQDFVAYTQTIFWILKRTLLVFHFLLSIIYDSDVSLGFLKHKKNKIKNKNMSNVSIV